MNTLKEKINAVINTLQTLEIKSEYNTMNKLVGCLQVLSQVSKELDNINQNTSSEEPQIAIGDVEKITAEE